jgi:hypothetical protein
MSVIEVQIDGKPTTFAATKQRKRKKTPTKLRPEFKAFGVPGEETLEQLKEKKRAAARQRLRNKLLAIVRRAMKEGAEGRIDLAKLKIAYELLLKDEAAELKREQSEGTDKPTAPVVVTDEMMAAHVRRFLGKEFTL